MIKAKEERFKIIRSGPHYKGIEEITTQSKDLKTALQYIENYGHFPNVVKITIDDKDLTVYAVNHGYSGRKFLNRNATRQKEIDESWAATYRQKWIQLYDDIVELFPVEKEIKKLQLSLKKKWFEMTKQGIKKEDYREITPYWCNRLTLLNGKKLSKEQWRRYLITSGVLYMSLCTKPNQKINPITFIEIDENIMTWGYPSPKQKERILRIENEGIEIRKGNPDWGAEKDKLYFVIKHGKILID